MVNPVIPKPSFTQVRTLDDLLRFAREVNEWVAQLTTFILKLDPNALTTHLTDPTDAHDASAISFVPGGTIAATNAQTAIAEVATDAATALSTHEADTTSVHGITDTSTLYRSGGTDVAVADGGTGSSTASGARTNLGLVIATDVEAHDADLTTIAGLSPSNDDVIQRKAGAWANRTVVQLKTDIDVISDRIQEFNFPASQALTASSITGHNMAISSGDSIATIASATRPSGWAGPSPISAIQINETGLFAIEGTLVYDSTLTQASSYAALYFLKANATALTAGHGRGLPLTLHPTFFNSYSFLRCIIEVVDASDFCLFFGTYTTDASKNTWSSPGTVCLKRLR